MISLNATLALLCALALQASAGVLSGSHTAAAESSLTTSPPSLTDAHELRKRIERPGYWCGTNADYDIAITCQVHTQSCRGTIFPDRNAYAYCSTEGVANQIVLTTGIAYYSGSASCGLSTLCWYVCSIIVAIDSSANISSTGTESALVKLLFVAEPYTATAYECTSGVNYPPTTTVTLNPATNVLDPKQYKISLAELAASTSSSSSTVSTPTSISKTPKSSKPPEKENNSGSGLSSGTKIGIGAGVGAGVGIVLIALIVFFCWRRHNKKKEERLAEVSTSQVPGSPGVAKPQYLAYSPPMSYDQSQYYHQGTANPGWSPQPSYSQGGYQDAGYPPREMHAQ